MKEKQNKLSATPYDDVFRTLLTDCTKLIVPVVNEMFGKHYTGDETVELRQNERFIRGAGANEDKIISDSYFVIGRSHPYHIECQSSPDGSMLIRMWEYDTQIALDEGILDAEAGVLKVQLPASGIMYLRDSSGTPNDLRVEVGLPDGREATYRIPILKVKGYSVEEIFDKRLYFLIPFHLFVYENRFAEYEKDEVKRNEYLETLRAIVRRLEQVCKSGQLTEFDVRAICDMTEKVSDALAANFENVREEVDEVMGGQVLDYPAKNIFNMGRAQEREANVVATIKNGVPKEVVLNIFGLTEEEYERYLRQAKNKH